MDIQNSALETLTLASDEDLYCIFDESYAKLILCLKSDISEQHLKTISILERFLKLNSKSLNTELLVQFANICADLKRFYIENVEKINQLVSTKVSCTPTISKYCSIIHENCQALSCIRYLFQNLHSHDVPFSGIHKFVLDTINMLSATFKHCTDHGQFYVTAISRINEMINNLFKQCNELLFQCLDFVSNTKIDSNDETDIQLLDTILESIFLTGTLVSNLELKTMAQLWKSFTSLLQKYSSVLRNQFKLCQVIQYFCSEIGTKIMTVYKIPVKDRTVTLKVLNFLLKVVIKLCESFSGCLSKCTTDLHQLILLLYRNSSFCAKYDGLSSEIASEIERSLLAAIDPLVTILIKEEAFVEYFLKSSPKKTNSANTVSNLLLLSIILQKLILLSLDTRSTWLTRGLFEAVFENISSSSTELHFDVRIAVTCGSLYLPQDIYLYDALVVYVANLIICTVSEDEFFHIEKLLITNLLRSPPAVKIFVCDLWCIITRYGSSELCFQHVKLLVIILRWLHCEKIECVFVKSLLARFFKFLSRSQQQKILDFVSSDWGILVEIYHLSRHQTLSICDHSFIAKTSERLLELLNQSSSFTSLDDDLLVQLEVACKMNENTFEHDILKYVHSLWEHLQNFHLSDSTLFSNCVYHLFTISRRYMVQHVTALPIIEYLLTSESVFLKLVILDYLKSLGLRKSDDMSPDKFASQLAVFFRSLLTDKNVIIREHALETFSYFSHVTTYEKIIRITVADEPQIAKSVADFLQNKVSDLSCGKTCDEFLKNLLQHRRIDVVPEHSFQNLNLETTSGNPQPKKIKLDFDFDREINEIELRIKYLCSNLSCSKLDQNQKDTLKRVIDIAGELKNYL